MRVWGYRSGLVLMLLPFVIGSVVLVIGPAVVSGAYAFTRYDALSPPVYAGLDVFADLFRDPEFHDSLVATAIIAGIAVPLRVFGALGLALLLHRRERLAVPTRVAAFVPVVTPDAATALLWLWLVNPVYGPIGAGAGGLGFDGPALLDPWGSRLTIIAISVFALGEGFLVMLAARRELPGPVYDAARVEGAGPWATFRRVTLPLLVPVLAFLVARDLVMALQSGLVPTLLLTDGGPLNATKTLPVFTYERGFAELRLGDAAAIAVILFVLSVVVLAVQYAVLRRWLRAVR